MDKKIEVPIIGRIVDDKVLGNRVVYKNMEKKISVNDIIKKLESGQLENPAILSDYVVILSASLFTGGKMEIETRIEYAKKWKEIKTVCKTDKQADMEAMLTEEYKLKELAALTTKTILNCIQSLKKKLVNLSDELRSAQNY